MKQGNEGRHKRGTADREALALGRNAELMAYLDEVSARARDGERYSLDQIQEEFSLAKPAPPARRRKRK